MIASESLNQFWQSYLQSLPTKHPHRSLPLPEAWGFADGGALADELGQLVYDGIKTATCSMLWDYEVENEDVPTVGSLSIILDGQESPWLIIETTEITIRPFNEVDPIFASEEGEGDRSLAYWREAHWRFFGRTWRDSNRPIREDMPLVCERFQVLFRRD
jgi:uncharacterized protein YhfF